MTMTKIWMAVIALMCGGCTRSHLIDSPVTCACEEVSEISLYNFNDPALDDLLDRAYRQNLDLQIATLRGECVCDVWRSVSAEVAKNYIELRGLQQRVTILQRNIDSQKDGLQLIEDRLTRGIANEFDLKEIEGHIQALIAQNPSIEQEIGAKIQRLAILVGDDPGAIEKDLSPICRLPSLPIDKSICIPSEWLRCRPDVRKAEKDLGRAIKCRRSGIAYFCLTGHPEEVEFAPLCVGKASRCQRLALYSYGKTVREAIEEVENRIAAYQAEWQRNKSLSETYHSSQQALDLINDLSDRGIKDYLDVLTVSRALFTAEEALLESHIALRLAYVSLYSSL